MTDDNILPGGCLDSARESSAMLDSLRNEPTRHRSTYLAVYLIRMLVSLNKHGFPLDRQSAWPRYLSPARAVALEEVFRSRGHTSGRKSSARCPSNADACVNELIRRVCFGHADISFAASNIWCQVSTGSIDSPRRFTARNLVITSSRIIIYKVGVANVYCAERLGSFHTRKGFSRDPPFFLTLRRLHGSPPVAENGVYLRRCRTDMMQID